MSVIVLLIAAGALVAGGFLVAFIWAVQSGQFDDTATPAIRILLDDRAPRLDAAPSEHSPSADPRPEGATHDQPRL